MAVIGPELKRDRLTGFRQRAKQSVLTKQEAYRLSAELGIHLSEHGGTGQGVVGALAGTGLRLGGNDGRFRGWYHLGRAGEAIRVATLMSHPFIDLVLSESGEILTDDTIVRFSADELKTVLLDDQQVLLVRRKANGTEPTQWITLTRQQVKSY